MYLWIKTSKFTVIQRGVLVDVHVSKKYDTDWRISMSFTLQGFLFFSFELEKQIKQLELYGIINWTSFFDYNNTLFRY